MEKIGETTKIYTNLTKSLGLTDYKKLQFEFYLFNSFITYHFFILRKFILNFLLNPSIFVFNKNNLILYNNL